MKSTLNIPPSPLLDYSRRSWALITWQTCLTGRMVGEGEGRWCDKQSWGGIMDNGGQWCIDCNSCNPPKTHQVIPRKCPMDPTGGPLRPLVISGVANDKSVPLCHPKQQAGLMGLALEKYGWVSFVYFYLKKKIYCVETPKYKVSQ